MDITNGWKQLNNLYENYLKTNTLTNNEVLRLDFNFQRMHYFLLFSKRKLQENQFCLVFDLPAGYFVLNFFVNKFNTTYQIKTYIGKDYNIINNVFYSLNTKNWSPNDTINNTFQNIKTTLPYRQNLNQIRPINKYKSKADYKYFHNFTSKNLSSKMESKINEIYQNKSSDILKWCKENGQTLVFTPNIWESQNIFLVMQNFN